ncbi:hypothetical protein POJ06DRAFT_11375 [Lipomyces tetrasporus]|uniref:Uncharacterized protein n=1 Tax=Lipomyces tetrasporus TaxID=54092 RepID=A0AAD7VVZ7_9ASCO|nr:uncharacterized protein POJ06DRAFT_11375 [Lipomyces tetrasporus]KAJ8104048.1 hypothetical protein POJ06DRAFT_11375 [Lipomyces tetrasporus]
MVDSTAPETSAPVDAAVPVVANGAAKSSAFVAHLRSYPIVDATVSYTSNLPLVKKASATAKPYVDKYVHPAVERAAPVLSRVDKLGDSTLDRVDKFVPALKTTAAPDIPGTVSKSVESVKSTTHLYTEAARTRVNDTVVEPTKQAVDKAKQRTVALYDSKGRPFVRAKLDPVLAPLNSRLIALLDAYLPPAKSCADGTAPEGTAATTELGRLYLIGTDAVSRVKPVIEDRVAATRAHGKETVDYFLSVPSAAKSHVISVWEEKRSKTDLKGKPITGPLYVTLSLGKQIVFDVVSYAEAYAQEKVGKVKSMTKSITNGHFKTSDAPSAVNSTPEPVQE